MSTEPRIGVVVLTYNSDDDLPLCLEGVLMQRKVELRLVVVDNASEARKRKLMENAFVHYAGGEIAEVSHLEPSLLEGSNSIFIRNDINAGYSAGNNIGLRLLSDFGCDAVLIVNPDVRMRDKSTLLRLWRGLEKIDGCVIASPRILKPDGSDEHPLREPGFWEEFLWFRQALPRPFRPPSHVLSIKGVEPIEAAKVHGSCMLLKTSFLKRTNFLDENVFLYSEEAILAARARRCGGRMFVIPDVQVVHEHIASRKENAGLRMIQFIKSRLYFLRNYSEHGFVKLALLRISYAVLAVLHKFRSHFQ